MQLSRFDHLYLRFSSSEVSVEIIGINLITSLTFLLDKKAVIGTVFGTFLRQKRNASKVLVIKSDSLS